MSDLEMVRACAIAIGEQIRDDLSYLLYWHNSGWQMYDPLHDDGQAMALVKRFRLCIDPDREDSPGWGVISLDVDAGASGKDLNRAIVQCVAHLHHAKTAKTEGGK